MSSDSSVLECPDCGDPLAYTFTDTAGVGAWKLGDGYNTTPDTRHYICLPCAKAWKQRLSGPFTPDIVGDLAFFTCRTTDCGGRLAVIGASSDARTIELACGNGHRHAIQASDDGGLIVVASST